ncbi:MAG: NADH-quinone oxidoreductase subunit NuoG [Rickettsiaceae bacterium]|nr:NADH-quinone oxidoreductase subunit NuoG [Rickettsiaceae bacterium]
MPKLTIDGNLIEVEDGLTLIQACEIAGIQIPRFCYHEKLKIAGNCRMCLVDVEKSPKPVASCAMPVLEGMIVHTDSDKVKKWREAVLELLLINHPLDCPVCDQGGECDLQDITYQYAIGKSRFDENKRIVPDKNMGPLIKTAMTRCIHCTRCIRFMNDVAGVEEIAAAHRGEDMEITTLEKGLTSELSANIIDICPVGALVSKPYAFKARPWELAKTESIDVLDALGSNIRVDSRGLEVMRILPKINEDINEEWISDKTRYACDGLKYQRLDKPYVRDNYGRLIESTWQDAIEKIASRIKISKPEEIAAIAGTMVDCETMFAAKLLFKELGCLNITANQFNYKLDPNSRSNYIFNSSVVGIEQADLCLLLGANPRNSSPVLNARIGKAVRGNNLKVYRLAANYNLTYPVHELGANPKILHDIFNGQHFLAEEFAKSKTPMIIIGDEVLIRDDAFGIMTLANNILDKQASSKTPGWNGFNILHNHASIVGSLDVGFYGKDDNFYAKSIVQKFNTGKINLLYLLGADEILLEKNDESFVIYQGHHGDVGARYADVILPSPAYTEKDAIYVNLEGRPQKAYAAHFPIGQAKYDWEIINMIASNLGVNLGYKDLNSLRGILAQYSQVFLAQNIDNIIEPVEVCYDSMVVLFDENFVMQQDNYYQTDVISRSSPTMAKCAALRKNKMEAS